MLRDPIDINTLKVRIAHFSGEEIGILSFVEVSKEALQNEDLDLCPAILKKGRIQKGSFIYELIRNQ